MKGHSTKDDHDAFASPRTNLRSANRRRRVTDDGRRQEAPSSSRIPLVFEEEEHDNGGGGEDLCVGILPIETACASDVTLARAANDVAERFV